MILWQLEWVAIVLASLRHHLPNTAGRSHWPTENQVSVDLLCECLLVTVIAFIFKAAGIQTLV
jgi:hypothetical protein